MAELKNEFSWSKTRDEVFRTCPRQYWFAYYGYWNGWLENAPERTRQIYILRNLKDRHIWAGEKVHECIQRSLTNIRKGIKVLPIDEVISIIVNQMRADFRSSRSRNYLKNPQTCGLFEHEYGMEVTDDQWKEVAHNVETCLKNFYSSDIYDALKSLSKEDWLEVKEFSSFHLDNIKINLVIECAIREEENICLYDWKMEKSLSEDLPIQLSCYSLYAMEKWNIPPERLHITEFNLSFNEANWFAIESEQVEDAKGYIRGSIKDMQSLLVDPENNVPMEEGRFSKIENERVSSRCNFRKICK